MSAGKWCVEGEERGAGAVCKGRVAAPALGGSDKGAVAQDKGESDFGTRTILVLLQHLEQEALGSGIRRVVFEISD